MSADLAERRREYDYAVDQGLEPIMERLILEHVPFGLVQGGGYVMSLGVPLKHTDTEFLAIRREEEWLVIHGQRYADGDETEIVGEFPTVAEVVAILHTFPIYVT